MSNDFWIALLIQLCVYGISVGTIYGTVKTRLSYIENKLDKHNNLIERTYKIEQDIVLLQEKTKNLSNEVEELERS